MARCARCGEPVDPRSSRVLHSHEGRYFHGYDADCKPREYGTEMSYLGYRPNYHPGRAGGPVAKPCGCPDERALLIALEDRRPLLVVASPRTVRA